MAGAYAAPPYQISREDDAEILSRGRRQSPDLDLNMTPPPDLRAPLGPIDSRPSPAWLPGPIPNDIGGGARRAPRREHLGFGGLVHRDDGGATPMQAMPVQTQAMQNPIAQQEYSHFSAMTPEQLQETALRLKGSPQGAMVQRILQQKRMTPQPTAQPDLAGMPQQYAIGGTLQAKGGVHIPERAPSSGMTPPTAGGFLHTAGPGRSDNLNIKPHADSYVLPADVVSGLGEGNSLAGAKALEASFHTGPYGTPMPAGPRHAGHRMGAAPKMPGGGGFHLGIPHALGGAANDNFGFGGAPAANDNAGRGHNGGPPLDDDEDDGPRRVPIVAAGGEYIVSPDQCRALGHGDITRGHEILDKFVLHVRKRTVGELRKLKGPVKT